MYQYNILNSCIACLELKDVVNKTISGLLVSKQNVDDIKNEALELLKSDQTLEKHDNLLRITLIRVVASNTGKENTTENGQIERSKFHLSLYKLKNQLDRLCDTLKESYIEYVVQDLKEALNSQDQALIERYSSILISQCIYSGWSPKGLFLLSHILRGENTTLEDKVKCFFDTVMSTPKAIFDVFTNIQLEIRRGLNKDTTLNTIKSLGLNIKKGSDIANSSSYTTILKNLITPDNYYILDEVEAFDAHSAVLTSINNLQSKISIAFFYNIISPYLENNSTIHAYNKNSHKTITLELKDVFQTYDHIDSSNAVFEATNRLLNIEKHIISDKLRSVFSYTSLSKSSFFQETKYITLWIALESIMKTGQYTDIISHIKNILPPSLCIRYFYRIARNFAEDCKRCKIDLSVDPINIDLDSGNKRELVSKIITYLRDPVMFQTILLKCSVNDLLYYRCKQIQEIFNDCECMRKRLLHYKIKVEWHIQRLYRIRNEITHSAFHDDRSLVIYIEHLYSYLSQLISEIVFYVENKNAKSIEEAYALLEMNYLTFIEVFNSNTMELNDVLPCGIIETL